MSFDLLRSRQEILSGTKMDGYIWVNDVYCKYETAFRISDRLRAHCRSLFLTNYENPRSPFYVRLAMFYS